MNSISIVSTQMQLVNCVEAIRQYGFTHNDLIVWSSSTNREKQLISLLDRFDYKSYFHNVSIHTRLSYGGVRSILSIFKEKKFFKKSNCSVDAVLIGNYKLLQVKYFLHKLLRKNSAVNVISLDDGIATCEAVSLRNKEIHTHKMAFDDISRLFKLVYLGGFLWGWKSPEKVVFYTSFEQLIINSKVVAAKNNYSYIKSQLSSKSNESLSQYDVVFLGQPLVQMALLTSEQYSRYILEYINKYTSCYTHQIVYIPHPAEETEQSLSEEIRSVINIKRLDLPIELYLIASSTLQKKKVVGFYTSALVVLKQMIPCNIIDVFSIYVNEIEKIVDVNEKRILEDAYGFIEDSGVPILVIHPNTKGF